MKERWMGLDYGTKTVGVAVSDVLGITAQGVETVTRKSNKKLRQTLARIEALIEEYEVSKVVLGLPKNMNNTLGERAEETKEFQAMLQRRTGFAEELPLPIIEIELPFSRFSPCTLPYADGCKTSRLL